MKGIQGIIVAVFLGLFGLALNWLYLSSKTKGIASVSFVGIRDGALIRPGEVIKKSDLVPVSVPSNHVGDLEDFVYLWEDLGTVAGTTATRQLRGGELYFRKAYKTPSEAVSWYPDVSRKQQRLMWVSIDDKSFVPSLVDPGDKIWFVVPSSAARIPTSALADGGAADTIQLRPNEQIGPFRVGSLGNRLGSARVMRASGVSTTQEGRVGIVVKMEVKTDEGGAKNESFDAKTLKLRALIERTNSRGIGVLWDPKESDEAGAGK